MTNELKAAFIASLLTGIITVGAVYLTNNLNKDQMRMQIELSTKKEALKELYLNVLKSEKICKSIQKKEKLSEINIKELLEIEELNLKNDVLIDLYLPYFELIHSRKKASDQKIYSFKETYNGLVENKNDIEAKEYLNKMNSFSKYICIEQSENIFLFKDFIKKEQDEIISGVFKP